MQKLVVTLFLFSLSIGANDCKEVFLPLLYSKRHVGNRLKTVPFLRDLVLETMKDPKLPLGFKRVIKKALDEKDLSIQELTAELRNQFRLSPRYNAGLLKINRKRRFLVTFLTHDPTLGGKLKTELTLLVQQRPLTPEANDLSSLVHELAHVRFDSFVEKRIEKLQEMFPDQITRYPDGSYMMDDELYTYLTERYAYETQYRFIKELEGRYFEPMASGVGTLREDTYRTDISDHIVNAYGITNPKIVQLRSRTLRDIFLGGIE